MVALVFLLLGQILGQPLVQQYPDRCVTPNDDIGLCIPIQNCPHFVEAIQAQKSETYDFLRASRCGPDNEDVSTLKVCCGRSVEFHKETESKLFQTQAPPLQAPALQAPAWQAPTQQVNPIQHLFPRNCGIDHGIANRITGGKEADLGEFPWMARLEHRRDDGRATYGCVGFLVSERFVITAAHCINSSGLAALGPIYRVQLGEHNIGTDPDCDPQHKICLDSPQLLRTSTPIVHPEYSAEIQQYNDIAVIPLVEPATFTNSVQPICLPDSPPRTGSLWVAGWGQTETKNSNPVKLKAILNLVNKRQCTTKYESVKVHLRATQLCAEGTNGQDSCTGDSGGPLMGTRSDGKWYAEGIVSFGYGCGEEGWPGVYTSTAHLLSWVKGAMKDYLAKSA